MEEWVGTTMSDATASNEERHVSQRFADVEDELRDGEGLGSLMAEQWRGMAGMAGMFVATIALAMYIRPYYDVGELHAFGASGATQVRYVALELVAIFAFTALIIFLAKWGKQYIIKYGMYAVLTIALMYTTVPLAHMLVLDFETTPFEIESAEDQDGVFVGTWGEYGYILYTVEEGDVNTTVELTAWDASNDYVEPVWNLSHPYQVYESAIALTMTTSNDMLTFASGDYAWSVDITTGELTESYACHTWVDGEYRPLDNMYAGCVLAVSTTDAVYLINAYDEMVRFNTFEEFPGVLTYQARWAIPGFSTENTPVESHLLNEDEWLLVTPDLAASVLLESNAPPLDDAVQGALADATYLMQQASDATASFTSADVGWSPFMTENFNEIGTQLQSQRFIIIGDSEGSVVGIEWNGTLEGEEAYTVQKRMNLDGLVSEVSSVRITDLDDSGYSDLLVVGDGQAHWLYTTSLVNRASFDVAEDVHNVFFALDDDDAELVVLRSSPGGTQTTVIERGELTSEMFPLYGLQLLTGPTLAGLAVTVLLLILLVVHSEWYVVNTTGVLLGAGVSVMLGVTFVPALAIVFMALAAVYDFWAVYKSKHMLDLADTMVGLRLPILLVAPQDSEYSLIEETERAKRPAPSPPPEGAMVKRKRKKNSEAMFMGLGDIIFPGMLVLSAMQWLDPSVAFEVAMFTLVGALLGYLVLMTYVARGKAQAGLPLLNGGAILGFFIGGLLFVGGDIFSFNISW